MKEKEPGDEFLLGCYYDNNSLYIFQRKKGIIYHVNSWNNYFYNHIEESQNLKISDDQENVLDPFLCVLNQFY